MIGLFVIGLGNPGKEYEATRHNLGFLFLDRLEGRSGQVKPINKRDWPHVGAVAVCKTGVLEGRGFLTARPQTFMNASGSALRALIKDIGSGRVADVVVVYDDMDLPLGTVRVRKQGSAGTHNGMKSMLEAVPSGEFIRLRLGIGPKPAGADAADFVLSAIPKKDAKTVDEMLEKAVAILEVIVKDGVDLAISKHSE